MENTLLTKPKHSQKLKIGHFVEKYGRCPLFVPSTATWYILFLGNLFIEIKFNLQIIDDIHLKPEQIYLFFLIHWVKLYFENLNV